MKPVMMHKEEHFNVTAVNTNDQTWNASDEYTFYNHSDTDDGYYNNESDYTYMDPTWEHMYYYYLWTYVAPIMFGCISAVGIIGNGLVTYVILSGKVMRTVTNILLLNLAFADIMFLLIVVPITAHKYASFSWIFGDFACKAVQFLMYVTTYVTVWSLVAISAIRFLTVVYSNSTVKFRTKRNIVVLSLLIWVISVGVNIPVMLSYKVKTVGTYSYCGMYDYAVEGVFVSFTIFGYALPLIAISVMYVLIMMHLQNAQAGTVTTTQTRTRGRTAKACKVIIVVVLVFLFSWLPFHINLMVGLYGKIPDGIHYEFFRILFYCMAYSNSCANPIIYNYVSNDFRKAFQEVICCCSWRVGANQRRVMERPTETEMTQMLETKA